MEGFIEYLTGRIDSCREETAVLEKEGRHDDADFSKVRTNIYDACRSVTNALKDRPGAGAEAVEKQFARFRATWGDALEKAREHGDAKNTVLEEIKLETLSDVIARFEEAVK